MRCSLHRSLFSPAEHIIAMLGLTQNIPLQYIVFDTSSNTWNTCDILWHLTSNSQAVIRCVSLFVSGALFQLPCKTWEMFLVNSMCMKGSEITLLRPQGLHMFLSFGLICNIFLIGNPEKSGYVAFPSLSVQSQDIFDQSENSRRQILWQLKAWWTYCGNLLSCKAIPEFQGAAIHFERRGEKPSGLTMESRVLVRPWANLKILKRVKLQDLNIQWNDSWSNSPNSYEFSFGWVTNQLGSVAPREWHTASL